MVMSFREERERKLKPKILIISSVGFSSYSTLIFILMRLANITSFATIPSAKSPVIVSPFLPFPRSFFSMIRLSPLLRLRR